MTEEKGTRVGPHGVSGTLYGPEEVAAPWRDGAALIAAERQRQIDEEGYTAEHDVHQADSLMQAAIGYIAHTDALHYQGVDLVGDEMPVPWPWSDESWKPTGDEVRDLTKAGALIAAAIDAAIARDS